jgi:hypothetical protein
MITKLLLMFVDPIGVTHISEDEEAVYSVLVDLCDVVYLGTQQSCNFSNEKGKDVVHVVVEEEALDQDDLYYSGEVENEAVNNIVVPEEEKSRKKLFTEKNASLPNAEEEEILE